MDNKTCLENILLPIISRFLIKLAKGKKNPVTRQRAFRAVSSCPGACRNGTLAIVC